MKPIRTDWCMTFEDLYRWTDPAKWNITAKFVASHNAATKWSYCSKVLIYLLRLIIEDIIENNITVEIPCVGSKAARFYVKCYSGDEFIEMYKRGVFKGIDYVKSEFKGYQLMFQWQYKTGHIFEKQIHIDRTTKARFYELINNGKQYY